MVDIIFNAQIFNLRVFFSRFRQIPHRRRCKLTSVSGEECCILKERLFADAKIRYVPLSKLRYIGRRAGDDLIRSVMRFGILNPILVSEQRGEYAVITGSRRLDAAKCAGLTEIPCIILHVQPFDADIISMTDDTLLLPKTQNELRARILRFQTLYRISNERIKRFAGILPKEESEKAPRKVRTAIGDRRIFLNTVNRAADFMRLSGYKVDVSSSDDVQEIKINLSQM